MIDRPPLHAILPIAPPGSGKTTFIAAFAQHAHAASAEPSQHMLELDRASTSDDDQRVWDSLRGPLLQGSQLQRTEEPSAYRLNLTRFGVTHASCLLLDYPGGRFFAADPTHEIVVSDDLKRFGWLSNTKDTLTVVLFINHSAEADHSTAAIDLPMPVKTALADLEINNAILYLALADQVWPKRDFRSQLADFNRQGSREQALALHEMMLPDPWFINSAVAYLVRRQRQPPRFWALAGSSYGALPDGRPNASLKTRGLAQPLHWMPLGVMPVLHIARGGA